MPVFCSVATHGPILSANSLPTPIGQGLGRITKDIQGAESRDLRRHESEFAESIGVNPRKSRGQGGVPLRVSLARGLNWPR